MVKAIPYLFKKIYHASLWDHRRKSILFNLISKLIFITLIFTISGTNLLGQIVIREKIKINPSNNLNIIKTTSTTTSNIHTVQYVVEWDKPNREALFLIADESSGWLNGGYFEYTESDVIAPTHVGFQIRLNLGYFETSTINYKIYVDGNETFVDSFQLKDTGGHTPYENISHYLDIQEYIDAKFYTNNLCIGDKVYIDYWLGPQSIWSTTNPYDYKYNFEITTGSDIASLLNVNTGEVSDLITNIDYLPKYKNYIYILVDGNTTDANAKIKLKISANSDEVIPYEKEFDLIQSQLKVFVEPNTLSPGDTALVTVKKIEQGGALSELPENTYFEIGLIEGCQNADISAWGVKYDYLSSVTQPIKLIVNETLEDDSFSIKLRVGTYTLASQPLSKTTNSEENSNITNSDCYRRFSYSIYGIADVEIGSKDSVDHFNIEIKPDSLINGINVAKKDTIAFTELASLYIKAMDADSNATELDSTKLLRFEITTNTKYGTFIKPNGDTLQTHSSLPVVLENITYGDAKNGKVKFAAVKANPKSVVKCRIKVTLQDDVTTKGEKEAVVLEQTLKIEMKGEKEVKPIITTRRYDANHATYLENINKDNRKFFGVRLTRGKKAIKNHKIKLRTDYIDESGGHNHTSTRRSYSTGRLRRLNYGSFYSYSSGEEFNSDYQKGMKYERTRQDTNSRFEYVASIWGDTMTIYLESLENKLLKDSVKITERITDLEPLGEDKNYILVGGREEHHGPPSYTDDNNHYGTETINRAIKNISSDYRDHFKKKLVINDMSLPNGGKFDIEGEWQGSHCEHRLGRNVDIRSRNMKGDRYLDENKDGVYNPDPVNNPKERLLSDINNNGKYDGMDIEVFRKICEENAAGGILLENPADYNSYAEHWHLEF